MTYLELVSEGKLIPEVRVDIFFFMTYLELVSGGKLIPEGGINVVSHDLPRTGI